MAQQTINVGTAPNDGTGTPLRTAFQYTNSNFSELYTAVGPSGNNIVVPGSATITGDLTVRTNVISATSSGVGFGINTAAAAIDVVSSFQWRSNTGGTDKLAIFSGGAGLIYLGSTTASALSFLYNGSTAMTLNSTGLGVGEAASVARLQPRGSTSDSSAYVIYAKNIGGSVINFMRNDGRFLVGNGTTDNFIVTETGNVGIGVTPSAWSSMLALQVRGASLSCDATVNRGRLFTNAFYDGAGYKYIQTNFASMYLQNSLDGVQSWHTAPSGTAGTAITFTQAMTLAANGQLLLGTSTTDGAIDIGMVLNKPSATGFVGNSYQLNGSSKAFTYISSSAGAFRVDTVTGYTINMVSATNGVYLANGGTSWTALSDERFKDIIEPISNAVAKVGSLRSVIGKFKTESEGTRRSFLIAQDVQAVLPEAVDASNPDQLGVAYTEVIPLLVAAIKELTARVQTLETR